MRKQLATLQVGQLRVDESDESTEYGGAARPDFDETTMPLATLEVLDSRFYRRLATGGALGAAESYLRGEWRSENLVALFQLLARNQATLQSISSNARWITRPMASIYHWLRRNSISGSRQNIHAHYDLGNDFFSLFLDPTMTYSSGYFVDDQSTLEEASIEKYDRICRRLRLRPEHHLVEIGTGWGGFALHAARNYGCHITTTTISAEQHAYARQQVNAAGLGDRIDLRMQDYRDLEGQFDRLVSIEMIEAVGAEFLPTYFQQCAKLLKPSGEMVIQAITIPDQRYLQYRKQVDFIQRYIFPGGCLPSLGAIAAAVSTTTGLQLVHLEDFAVHYARTLMMWRNRFGQRIDEVRRLGLDDRFIRMWDYYLAYCEAGFRERMTGVAQLHFRSCGH